MNLSVKDVPEPLVEQLRDRAKRNHRSLQGELLTILEEAAGKRRLSIWELDQMVGELGFEDPDESVEIIRELRDSR
ncbi:MAG TPA: Arc family DNA-binding protein [Chloroflexota bacterium]|jgi:plasmid stability protein|nr:Arc family DNA-binding protein [Chloroflexota bacterium]